MEIIKWIWYSLWINASFFFAPAPSVNDFMNSEVARDAAFDMCYSYRVAFEEACVNYKEATDRLRGTYDPEQYKVVRRVTESKATYMGGYTISQLIVLFVSFLVQGSLIKEGPNIIKEHGWFGYIATLLTGTLIVGTVCYFLLGYFGVPTTDKI